MKLRKGETVFSSTGELVVTHQVPDVREKPVLCFNVPDPAPCEHSFGLEGKLDRIQVKKLRDSLSAWLEMTK